jgi:hypothetical protein
MAAVAGRAPRKRFVGGLRIVLLVMAGWSGALAASGASLVNATPVAPSQTFAAALSPAQWKQVEDCVDRALAWLSSQQAPDGSFATPGLQQAQPAITSLCVLAFLSRGHQPGFGPYGAQMDRAIDFVISCQRPDGLFSYIDPDGDQQQFIGAQQGFTGRGRRGGASANAGTYNHAIAGLMLGEVFGHTGAQRTRQIKEALDKALLFTRDLQTRSKASAQDQGGWRYLQLHYDGVDSDMSVTGWHLMFLRSARNAEFNVPQKYIDDAMSFVRRSWVEEDGMFHYTTWGRESWNATRGLMGSGIVSLALAGQHESQQAQAAGDWLLAHPYEYYGQTIGTGDRFLYSTYYCSQAAAQLGGRYWNGIYPPIALLLVKNQEADGSFIGPGSTYGGGRGFGRMNGEFQFGQVYATAMAVLSLTPAYQLLPVYQR